MNSNQILSNAKTKWTAGGKKGDIVISSRIRLARNLVDKPFPHLLNDNDAKKLASMVREAFNKFSFPYFYVDLATISPIDRQVLVEKHLVSPALLKTVQGRGVVVSEDEALTVMINEEDHLRIQCLYGGLALKEAWLAIDALDKKMESELPFAYDRELGYLTACPTNLGTGVRASVMVHLPGLTTLKRTGQVFEGLAQMGFAVRGIYGEGSESKGHLYQISNQRTLGFSEIDIIQRLNRIAEQIVDAENACRDELFDKSHNSMADYIWRAWGIMTNARSLSSSEAMEQLSAIRLGAARGIIQKTDMSTLNELLIACQPGFVERKLIMDEPAGQINSSQRDWARAAFVRNKFNGNKN